MITVSCWSWGGLFGVEYVNRLRSALERHLHLDHQLVCITDDSRGIDPRVRVVPMPAIYSETPRCRRRMLQFHRDFWPASYRILAIDLDVVIVNDITPLVDRPEPIVLWKVGHAGVYSGSFLLYDAGTLHGAWERFAADPDGYPKSIQPRGVASDQAMINHYLATSGTRIAELTEADGLVSYYGAGYEQIAHLGVGPNRTQLPAGARIVVLGSADKAVMDEGRYGWVREHWKD
jgi:hypothetical protein